MNNDPGEFRLEIRGLAAFAAFIAIIKGETADLEKLAAALASFKTSNDQVATAIENNKE